MTADIIDGKAIAADIREEVRQQVDLMDHDSRPGLAVILVGGRRDSQTYVRFSVVVLKKKSSVITHTQLNRASPSRFLFVSQHFR
jgi:5,10-methylene-tetrahydrofolate dehydrogenase/methenyl tetrahydrofolate cyclohydrolase